MDNKNKSTMNEGMFSQIDQIRQDSKDVRDFVKKVFSDKEFKSMSKDTDFIKYLKSIYEGTVLDEEHVKFSNRTSTGTITTGSVQTSPNESIINEKINPKFYDARVQWIDPKYKKKFVGDVVRYDNGEYKVNLGKDGRFEKYILAKEKDLKIVSKSKKRTFESVVNEKKYNFKKDALTDYFKGKLTAQELDKVAKDSFGVGVATKKELQGFLTNKFTQDVMSDTYGIPSKTLVKRARDLVKFAENINEVSKLSMGIAGLTGTRGSAVEKFIKDYSLNDKELFKFLKKGKLKDRLNFATALSGRPGNKYQGDLVGLFGESVTPPNSNKVDALKKAVQKINKKYKVQVSKIGPTKGQVEIELGDGNHPDRDYHAIDKLVKKIGIKNYTVFNESSVNEKTTKNPKVWVDGNFSKLIDKLPNSKITRELVLKAAKKFKVNPKDAISFVEFDKMIDLDESTITEGTPFHVLFKVKKDVSNRSIKPATASYKSESDAKKFLKSVKKDGGAGMIVRRNEIKEDKKEISQLKKKSGKSETKFYDILSKVEKKYGKIKYRIWLEKSLKDFGVNSKHYDYRTNAAAEEKLFQLS